MAMWKTLAAAAAVALALMAGPIAGRAETVTESLLHSAAAADDAAAIRRLLAQGAGVDSRDLDGRTPLLVATRRNATTAADVLMRAGADVNARDHFQDSPYMHAAGEGFTDILLMTLNHGADLTATNRVGSTALFPAAEHGRVETVRMLLAAGIAVDAVNAQGWTALIEAIVHGDGGPRHRDVVRALIKARASVNLPDRDGRSPLTLARERGYTDMAAILVAAGAR